MNRPLIRKNFQVYFIKEENVTVVRLSYNGLFVINEVAVDPAITRNSSNEDLLNNYIGFDQITDNICVFNRRLFYKENSVDADYSSFIRYIVFLKKFQFDQNGNEIFDLQEIPSLPNLETFIRSMALSEDRWSPLTHEKFDTNFKSIIRYMLLSVRFRSQRSDNTGVLPLTRIPVEVLIYKVFPFLSPFDLHVAQDSFLRLTRRIFCLKEMLKVRYPLYDQFQTEMFLFGTQSPPSSSSKIINMFEDLNNDENSLLMYEKNLFDIVSETKKLLSSGMNDIHREWEGILRLFNIIILQSIGHKSSKHDDVLDIFETNNFFEVLLSFFNKTISEVKFQEKFEYRHLMIMMTDLFRTIFIKRRSRRRSMMENNEVERSKLIHIRKLEQTFFECSVKGIIDSFISSSSSSSSSSSRDSNHFDYELLWENTEKIKYYAVIILKLIKILRVVNKNSYYDQLESKGPSPPPPPPTMYLTGILHIMKQIQRRRYRLMVKKSFLDTLFQLHQNMSQLIFESISRMVDYGGDDYCGNEEGKLLEVMSEIVKYFHEYIISPMNVGNDEFQKSSAIISDLDPIFSNDKKKENNNNNEEEDNNKNNMCISEILLKKFFSSPPEEEEDEEELTRTTTLRTRLGNLFLRSIVRTQSYSWFHKIITNFETSWHPLTQQEEILVLFRIIYSYLNEVIDLGKDLFLSNTENNNNNNSNALNFFVSESLWTRRFLNILYNIIECQSFEFLKKHYFGKLIMCINSYFRTMRDHGNISSDTFVVQFLEKGILAAISKKKSEDHYLGGGEDISIEEILELVENRNFQVWFCAMESRKNRRHFGKIVMRIISYIIEKWEKIYGEEEEEEGEKEEEEREIRSDYREIIEYLRNELEFVKNLIDVDQKIEKKSDIFNKSLTGGNKRRRRLKKIKEEEEEEEEEIEEESEQKSLYELMREAWNVLAISERKSGKSSISDQISSISLFNLLFKNRRSNNNVRIYSSSMFELGRQRCQEGLLLGLTNVCRKSLTRIGDVLYNFVICEDECTGEPLKELRKKKTIKLVNLILEEFGRTKKNIALSQSEESNPFFVCGLEKWIVRIVIGMAKMTSQAEGMAREVSRLGQARAVSSPRMIDSNDDQNKEKKYRIIWTLESVLTKCSDDDEVMSSFMNKFVFMTLFQFLQKRVIIPYLHKSPETEKTHLSHKQQHHVNNNNSKTSVFFSHKELNLVLDCLRSLLHRPYLKVRSFESNEDLITSFSGVLENILDSHCSDMKFIITEQKKEIEKHDELNNDYSDSILKKRKKRIILKNLSNVQKIFLSNFSYGKIIFIREFWVFLSELNERFVKIFERIIRKFVTWLYELHEIQIFQEYIDRQMTSIEKLKEEIDDCDDDDDDESEEEEEEVMIVPPPMMINQYLSEFRQFMFIFLGRVMRFGDDDEIKSSVIHLLLTRQDQERRDNNVYLSFMKSFLCYFMSSSSSSSVNVGKEEKEDEDPTRKFFSETLLSLLLLDQENGDRKNELFVILNDFIGDILETKDSNSNNDDENSSLQQQQLQEQRNFLLMVKNNNVSNHRRSVRNSNIQKLEMLVLSIISFLDHVDIPSGEDTLESIVVLTCLYRYFSLQHYDQQRSSNISSVNNKNNDNNNVFLDILEKFSTKLSDRISEEEKEKIDRLVDEKLLDDSFTERIDFKISISNFVMMMNDKDDEKEEEEEETGRMRGKKDYFDGKMQVRRIEEVEVEYEEQEKIDFDSFWDNDDDKKVEEEVEYDEKQEKKDFDSFLDINVNDEKVEEEEEEEEEKQNIGGIEEVEVDYEEQEKKDFDTFWGDDDDDSDDSDSDTGEGDDDSDTESEENNDSDEDNIKL